MNRKQMKRDLEAVLFILGSPVDAAAAAEAFSAGEEEIRALLEELKQEYEERSGGLMIRVIDGKYQICTRPECGEAVRNFCSPVKEKKLSGAALEVLAIIAYRQPVTKSEIDMIRGVRSDSVLEGLIQRNLIEGKGRAGGLGRPVLYGTTSFFMEKFGISSLKDLPEIEDLSGLTAEDQPDDETEV